MLNFKNLNQHENYLANFFLEDARDYFQTINQEEKFEDFLELFSLLCNQRQSDPNQLTLNLFKNENVRI